MASSYPTKKSFRSRPLLANGKLDTQGKTGAGIGRAERFDHAIGRYIVYAKSTFPKELALDGLKVVVDAAHGARLPRRARRLRRARRGGHSTRLPAERREHQPQLRRAAPRTTWLMR